MRNMYYSRPWTHILVETGLDIANDRKHGTLFYRTGVVYSNIINPSKAIRAYLPCTPYMHPIPRYPPIDHYRLHRCTSPTCLLLRQP